jgi:hypothetical protein
MNRKMIGEAIYIRVSDRKYKVRDPSAVRRLFVRLAGVVGRQSALHKENSGFVAATLRRHISMFCGYQILFSRKDSMAVLPRPLALERACVTFSPLSFWTT